jgi:hypothetical protein
MNTRKNIVLSAILLFVLVFSPLITTQPVYAACSGIVYVDANSGAAGPNGCSWGTAFKVTGCSAVSASG